MVALTVVNYLGGRKTAWLTRMIVAVVLAALAVVVAVSALGGDACLGNLDTALPNGPLGVLLCVGLAVTLPLIAVIGDATLLLVGSAVRGATRHRRSAA